jgi:uncharacterized protein (DUF427 family)
MWNYHGQKRPSFASRPGDKQESVWDYPRPPALTEFTPLVEVKNGNTIIARSKRSKRILETASPPTVYIPVDDISLKHLIQARGLSVCEWKGAANYWALAEAKQGLPIGWSYPNPKPNFASIKDWLCFYPGRIDCFIAGELVRPQEGGFYGGWVTDNITGPWKGAVNTGHW